MNSWFQEEEELTNSIPMGHFGAPNDIGELAAFYVVIKQIILTDKLLLLMGAYCKS